MMKKRIVRNVTVVSLFALTLAISACSSNDDGDPADGDTAGETDGGPAEDDGMGGDTDGDTTGGDDTDGETDGGDMDADSNEVTVNVVLDSTSTVPPANVEGASGEGSFTVNTETGAVTGSVTVMGTSGTPNDAHIHMGAAGEKGDPIITLSPNDDSTVWTVPEDAPVLDEAQLALFEAGELYVNVHTDANPDGELRSQLIDINAPVAGSITISFENTSETMPMSPPVVALHNAPDADNGVRLFQEGEMAIEQVVEIAENGNNAPLVELATTLAAEGKVSAAGVAFTDPENPGPLLPGASASVTFDSAGEGQVLSLVSMVVCTNDGFSGIDSRALSAETTETFPAPIYDAGSEVNMQQLDYWVADCGGAEGNLGDDENGSITPHLGQAEAENPDYNFDAGAELLQVTVTRN